MCLSSLCIVDIEGLYDKNKSQMYTTKLLELCGQYAFWDAKPN